METPHNTGNVTGRPVEIPSFPIPERIESKIIGWVKSDIIDEGAHDQDGKLRTNDYFKSMCLLCHLAFTGARKRYGKNLSEEVDNRLKHELKVICRMGYPDLFLIIQDYVNWAKRKDIYIGPGRGSSPGSLVAYCLGITAIDPIRNGLLFERFINQDCPMAPVIDVDIEEEGRFRVIEYMEEKYGKDHVALVMTYGKMTQEHPLYEERLKDVIQLKGIHACAVILGRKPLYKYVPLATWTDKKSGHEHLVSVWQCNRLDNSGVLKLNIIELDTLNRVKRCTSLIKQRYDIKIDLGKLPLDDQKTLALYEHADTDGVFHFDSNGMKRILTELKPQRLEDLIMLDAMYRPDNLARIPWLIAIRKGLMPPPPLLPEIEKILLPTYGLTIYQEQVMEIARQLTGLPAEWTDSLRRALCRQDKKSLSDLIKSFIISGGINGHLDSELMPVWDSWVALGKALFNKSHAVAYAWLSYQTAWLKAHYPKEFIDCFLND